MMSQPPRVRLFQHHVGTNTVEESRKLRRSAISCESPNSPHERAIFPYRSELPSRIGQRILGAKLRSTLQSSIPRILLSTRSRSGNASREASQMRFAVLINEKASARSGGERIPSLELCEPTFFILLSPERVESTSCPQAMKRSWHPFAIVEESALRGPFASKLLFV